MKRKEIGQKMLDYARTLEAGTDRAQSLRIYNHLQVIQERSIAEILLNMHKTQEQALRHAHLLVNAGLGVEHKKASKSSKSRNDPYYGTFEFVDGSRIGGE